jgi:hypothetical protein
MREFYCFEGCDGNYFYVEVLPYVGIEVTARRLLYRIRCYPKFRYTFM